MIARKDGKSQVGMLRDATTDAVDLRMADGETIHVPVDQIIQRRFIETSLMPEGLVDGLKPVEFADLVAYLMSLKPAVGPVGSAN